MPEDEISIYDGDKSEFNAGIAALMRVHEAKKWLLALTDTNNILEYIKYLKMFYKELYPMMTTKKNKIRNDKNEFVDEEKSEREREQENYKLCQQIRYRILAGDKLTNLDRNFLEQWELELRDIDQQKDMNIPRKGDMRYALSSRR
jgi:hypothetical protein